MLAFAIMAAEDGELGAWLAPRLATHGVRLDGGGTMRTGAGTDAGATWSLVTAASLDGRPWHRAASPCPFVGPLAAYLVVTPARAGAPVPREVARAIATVGRGVVARLDDDRAVDTVALRAVELEKAMTPAGLDDGGLLLDRDPAGAYAADVLARIATAAAARGLDTRLRWRTGEGNPIDLHRVQPFGSDQLYPPVWGKGGTSIDPLHALRGLTVELWLHDLAGLDEPGFLASPPPA